jgi:hypothetical protein
MRSGASSTLSDAPAISLLSSLIVADDEVKVVFTKRRIAGASHVTVGGQRGENYVASDWCNLFRDCLRK